MIKAFGYCRTSSATNIGADKDSLPRQQVAIEDYAAAKGIHIADWFYDGAVKGDDPLEDRAGFSELLDQVERDGVRLVLVESADRLARRVLVQEVGVVALQERGVRLVTASGQDMTADDDPMKIAMRQMAAVFAQLEKARLVAKLAAARQRRKAAVGKCGGRYKLSELYPEAAAVACHLRALDHTYKAIAGLLADRGHFFAEGVPFGLQQVRRLINT